MLRLHELLMDENVLFDFLVEGLLIRDVEDELRQVLAHDTLDALCTYQLVILVLFVDFLEFGFQSMNQLLYLLTLFFPIDRQTLLILLFFLFVKPNSNNYQLGMGYISSSLRTGALLGSLILE